MHHVLLAEDNRLNQLVAVGALHRLDCDVEVVTNGAEAVDAWSKASYDAVLLDVMMPEVDGYQAASRIRAAEADENRSRTPIIGLSARALDTDRQAAVRAGMDDYIVKPLRQPDLEAAFARWVVPAPDTPATPPPTRVRPTSIVDVDRGRCRITLQGVFDELCVKDARSHVTRLVWANRDAAWTIDCTEASNAYGCIQILRSAHGVLGSGGTMTVIGADPELADLVAARFP